MRALVGTRIPVLPGIEPLAPAPFTVLYCYPGTNMPAAAEIPGAAGCTLESCTYRDRLADFEALGALVRGVSTQQPGEQAAFAAAVPPARESGGPRPARGSSRADRPGRLICPCQDATETRSVVVCWAGAGTGLTAPMKA